MKNLKQNKKAQMTLFIILAIIIILSSSILIYIRVTATEKTTEVKKIAGSVPEWAAPVNDYITECVKTLSIKAFKDIGEHGGYINMSDSYLSGKTFNIKPEKSMGYDASYFFEQPIAYWFYLKTPQPCIICSADSKAPMLGEIEGQVDRYINSEINNCLEDFKPIKQQGFDIKIKTNPSATTKVTSSNIIIDLDYDIIIKKEDAQSELKNFQVPIDINFMEIYNLALSTAYVEKEYQVFDNILLGWIGIYSGIERNQLPPIYDSDQKFSTATWKKNEVEINLKNIISSMTSLMQMNGTRNTKRIIIPGDSFKQGIYDSMFLDIFKNPFPNQEVKFIYDPSLETYLEITPRSGNTITASYSNRQEYASDLTPSTQINVYESFYDISYPLIVMITDNRSLNNQGYTFMFALQVNLDDDKTLLEGNLEGRTVTYDPNDIILDTNLVPSRTKQKSLMCNINQRISGNITIKTIDEKTKQPIENVALLFRCGDYNACPMGETIKDSDSGEAVFNDKFPICIGDGRLTLEKQDYGTVVISNFTTEYNVPKTIEVELEPARDKNITVKKIPIAPVRNLLKERDNMIYIASNLSEIVSGFSNKESHCENVDHREICENKTANLLLALQNLKYKIPDENIFWNDTTVSEFLNQANQVKALCEESLSVLDSSFFFPISSPSWYHDYYNQLHSWLTKSNDVIGNLQYLNQASLLNISVVDAIRTYGTDIISGESVSLITTTVPVSSSVRATTYPMMFTNQSSIKQMKFIPSSYNIFIIETDEKGIFIRANSSKWCQCSHDFCYDKCMANEDYKSVPYYTNPLTGQELYCGCIVDVKAPNEDINEKPFPYGGASMDPESGLWFLEENKLDSSNLITFYFLRGDEISLITEFEQGLDYTDYSRYRAFVEPELR